jgi:hypothetical protein
VGHPETRTFYARTQESARHWYNKLRRRSQVVLPDLEKAYELGHVLGRGNSAKVTYALHTRSRASYAVKSIMKEHLTTNPRKLVSEA